MMDTDVIITSMYPARNSTDIVCCNCCEPLQPIGAHGPPEVPSFPVYELTKGEEALKINEVLDRVFRFAHLRDLNEDELEENIPLCPNCANILSQLDTFFQEFDRVRRFDSYLSAKIDKLDEVIQSGIAGLKLQLQDVSEDGHAEAVSGNDVIKTEPEDPPQIVLSAGPWVVLKRLKPKEISECNAVEPDIDNLSIDEDGEMDFDPEFEPDYKEEADESYDKGSPPSSLKNRRASKRKFPKPENPNTIKSPNKTRSRRHSKPLKPASKVRRQKLRKTSAEPQNPESPKDVTEEAKPQVDLQSSDSDLLPSKVSKRNRLKQKPKIKTAARKPITKQSKTSKSQTNVEETRVGKPGRPRKDEVRELKAYRTYEGFYRRKLVHPYPCQYCPLDFDIESDRVEHVKGTHCDKKYPVVCTPCGRVFVSETGRKNHEPKCGHIPPHYHMPPFICETCGKEFQSWNCLSIHKKSHSDERPYACNDCNYRTKFASTLASHKRLVHTVTEVKCPDCNATLKNQFLLDLHLTRMHTERGKEKHKEALLRGAERARKIREQRAAGLTTPICSECNIDFQTILRLRIHQNEVHGAVHKKWQCEQCGKGFHKSHVLKRHIQCVHTNERPYICDQCGVSYKSPGNLAAHMDRAHTEGGQNKYNEYNRANYIRKRKLQEELAKAKLAAERPEKAVFEASPDEQNASSLSTTLD